jgi:Bifunctional DNA primase/polymerase, N-terminal
MTGASLIDQAILLLVERRWPMLPSTGTQKKPCVGWKRFQKQLPTVEGLRGWDRKFRPERWGLVTGELAGIVVADFDGEKGIELMRKWGINPHRRTGSGGYHCDLRHPGWRVPTLNAKSSKASWPWPGLDIRGEGGFAVMLGRNENGPYEQLRDLVPKPFDALPEEVRMFLRNHSEKEDVVQKPLVRTQPPTTRVGNRVGLERLIREALDMAPRSGRNNSGFWLACQIRDNGYSVGEAQPAMREYRSQVPSANMKGKRESYTEREMMASLAEAYSRTPRDPWAPRNPRSHDDSVPSVAPGREPARRGKGESLPERKVPAHGAVADDPKSIDIYVGYTGDPLVGYTGIPPSRKGYARVPREVYTDRRLEAVDIRVYSVLASRCWQGNVASVGKRLIAREACCAECRVCSSLKRLEAFGHIRKQPGRRRGQRAKYVLLSEVFGQKQRAGVEEVAMGRNGPRLVSVRKELGTARTSFPRPTAAKTRMKH